MPPLAGAGRGDSLIHELPGYGSRTHPFMHVLAEDAPDELRLGLIYLRPAIVSGAIAIGE